MGDLNVAASQRDVHAKLCWENMYGAEEKAELAALLRALPDVWRLRHPDTANAFTARPCHHSGLVQGACACLVRTLLHALQCVALVPPDHLLSVQSTPPVCAYTSSQYQYARPLCQSGSY